MDITGPDGAVTHGADQDWFPDLWQQRAGCGPTAAAVILSYLARTRPELAPLYPEGAMDRASFTGLMCRVWEHVTPVSHGLNRPEQMAEGMASFAAARGLTLTPGLFVFPSARTKRPPYEQVEAFVRRALERDCPVAFLNLHNGRVKELDYWHWVTITALEDTTAVILDSGSAAFGVTGLGNYPGFPSGAAPIAWGFGMDTSYDTSGTITGGASSLYSASSIYKGHCLKSIPLYAGMIFK